MLVKDDIYFYFCIGFITATFLEECHSETCVYGLCSDEYYVMNIIDFSGLRSQPRVFYEHDMLIYPISFSVFVIGCVGLFLIMYIILLGQYNL